jgi:threonine/homoserine/homoserine lactone efflux protein
VTAEHALAFLGFAVVVAGTPGPSNAMLTATGAQVGVRRGVPALVGVAAGMAGLMFVVAFGLGTLILSTPLLPLAIKWAGAVVLLWLAWKIATAHPTGSSSDPSSRPIGFLGAAVFQWVNPKSWLACTSAAAAFLDPRARTPAQQAALLALLFVLAALPCCFIWLAGGAVVQRALRSERAQRTFNLAMSVLLAASVVLFFT